MAPLSRVSEKHTRQPHQPGASLARVVAFFGGVGGFDGDVVSHHRGILDVIFGGGGFLLFVRHRLSF